MGLSFPAGSNASYTISPVIVRDGAGNVLTDAATETVVTSSDAKVVEAADGKLSFPGEGWATLTATTTIAGSVLTKSTELSLTVVAASEGDHT